MNLEKVSAAETLELLKMGYSLLDVRSSVEFQSGHIPGSVNFPILNDSERHLVGIHYKEQGRESAISLAQEIVSGPNKENKICLWESYLKQNPKTLLTCFRGGLRSSYAQKWLNEKNVSIPRVEGGYKSLRAILLKVFEETLAQKKMYLLTGKTGSGKTRLLQQMMNFVDLEKLANHRGSSFGYVGPQPAQACFENQLILKIQQAPEVFCVEDESRSIGACVLPDLFFNYLRSSPVIYLQVGFEERVKNIFEDYIQSRLMVGEEASSILFSLKQNVLNISKKLGGVRSAEVFGDLETIEKNLDGFGYVETHKLWITKLLQWYYDPYYESSFEKRKPEVVFSGSKDAVTSWWRAKIESGSPSR